LKEEIESYPALLEAGGRPPYPFHLLNEFFWDPEQYLEDSAYHDIILFWRSVPGRQGRTSFCTCHLWRWRKFCRVQEIIRERDVPSESTLIRAAEWDSWGEYVELYGQQEGQWSFEDYTRRIHQRMNGYGLSHPFRLKKDLKQQDKLTTWIEYLGYEFWSYHEDASYAKRFQRHHDVAWKKLLDSDVLRPGETCKTLSVFERMVKDAGEERRAKVTMESAAAAANVARKGNATSFSGYEGVSEADQKHLPRVQAAYTQAKATYELFKRRGDAITEFIQDIHTQIYHIVQSDSERHMLLLNWIQQQIPFVETEMKSCRDGETGDEGMVGGLQVDSGGITDSKDGERSDEHTHQNASTPRDPNQDEQGNSTSSGTDKRKRSCVEPDNLDLSKRPKQSSQDRPAGSLLPSDSDGVKPPAASL